MSSTLLAPVLEREEYIEQAYFFRTLAERLREGVPAQMALLQIRDELLTTTRLPWAVEFLATELKHSGQLGSGMKRLIHYFTPFQAFVMTKAEEEGVRFSLDHALKVLEGEARYRSENPTPAGLFVYEFEVLARCQLGYQNGLDCMEQDSFFDEDWRQFIETVRRSMSEVEFADLIYLYSEQYIQDQQRAGREGPFPRPLFGLKEGRIAKASHGRDPLYLFAALQRQLGYPEVPRLRLPTEQRGVLQMLEHKVRELELRLRLLEGEVRGQVEVIQALGKPETAESSLEWLKRLDNEE
ncbi:hypothetical protein HRbin36_01441 [bacterium HR36]|uniref:Hypothetical conserved protein n=1 Tax=uncultured Planctomycetota bacterium TaxID=120965 RepID=H5SLY4_9BACT|nr:hypothetical conserved protein [uncultured Planctomycetota bacterium]GBD36320.1 hypothetical protein HRbin36_01441 [bacterium HR36]